MVKSKNCRFIQGEGDGEGFKDPNQLDREINVAMKRDLDLIRFHGQNAL